MKLRLKSIVTRTIAVTTYALELDDQVGRFLLVVNRTGGSGVEIVPEGSDRILRSTWSRDLIIAARIVPITETEQAVRTHVNLAVDGALEGKVKAGDRHRFRNVICI